MSSLFIKPKKNGSVIVICVTLRKTDRVTDCEVRIIASHIRYSYFTFVSTLYQLELSMCIRKHDEICSK